MTEAPTPPPLSLEAFEALLGRHGSELSRFPPGEREAARRLVESEPRAAALLAAEAKAAALLSELPEVQPSPALMRRVFEIPAREEAASERRVSGLASLWAWPWTTGFAFALLLLLGAFTGWASAPQSVDETASSEAMEEDVEDWEALSELAFADELSEDF